MKKLFKYFGDASRNPITALEKMNAVGAEFITWANTATGARFIAKKSTIEKKAFNKACLKREDHKHISDDEVVKLSDNALIADELLFEMDAQGVDELKIKEGLGGSIQSKVTRNSINLLEEVMFNENFDYSKLFK